MPEHLDVGEGRRGSQTRAEDFLRLDLDAPRLLQDIPLHDVWQVPLPGGGSGRTIADVRSLMAFENLAVSNGIVRLLFSFRGWLGRLFRWDSPPSGAAPLSDLERVPRRLLERSTVAPGSRDGPFTVLYATDREALSAVRNATVHAFLVLALQPAANGYRLYWAIYVAPLGWLTRLYMALIDPFRRLLVYPAILSHVQRRWRDRYGSPSSPG